MFGEDLAVGVQVMMRRYRVRPGRLRQLQITLKIFRTQPQANTRRSCWHCWDERNEINAELKRTLVTFLDSPFMRLYFRYVSTTFFYHVRSCYWGKFKAPLSQFQHLAVLAFKFLLLF